MTDGYDENDFPKLIPDGNIRFGFKNKLKRSSVLDFECSEYEYQCIAAAEEGGETSDPQVEKYRKIRLKPDLNLTMPNKHLLKRNPLKTLLLRTVLLTVAAAAAVALILFAAEKQNENSENKETSNIGTLAEKAKIESDTIKDESESVNFDDILPESENSRIFENTATLRKAEKPEKRQNTQKYRQPETNNMLAVNEKPEPDDENVEKIRKHTKLETINVAFFPPTSDKHLNINPIYEAVKYRAEGVLENLIVMAENSTMDKKMKSLTSEINEKKNNIMDVIHNFSVFETLEKIGEKHYVDKYIKNWIKNNKNVPLEIFADSSLENKMEEYYDENGKLIKAEFYTNLSVNNLNKYINKIIN